MVLAERAEGTWLLSEAPALASGALVAAAPLSMALCAQCPRSAEDRQTDRGQNRVSAEGQDTSESRFLLKASS